MKHSTHYKKELDIESEKESSSKPHLEQSKRESNSKMSKSFSEKIHDKRKSIKYLIFNAIMKYTLLVGLAIGIIIILLGSFQELFVPINLFLIMMGTIYAIFNMKQGEELFREFFSMIGVLVFLALLITYINGVSGSVGMSQDLSRMMFRTLQYTLSICTSLFFAPLVVSSLKLVFLGEKRNL
ncbi:MAG: hypothetical protein ACLFPL_01835 [Candidatus Nanoarchaeia archaeon]